MLKIITVASQKGGSGKTTLTSALAAYASSLGLRVILVDLDPQQSLAAWWRDRAADDLEMIEASADELREGKLRSLDVDLCLVDTPPAHDIESKVLAALEAADLALIPVRPSALDLGAVARTVALTNSAKVPRRFVISQAVARSALVGDAVTVISNYGPISGVVHSRTLYAAAMAGGLTAPEIEPRGKAAAEIAALWRNVSAAVGHG
jgi:chromosome partitioning protein